MEAATVQLSAADGTRGVLTISALPRATYGPELSARGDTVTIREARVYRFRFDVAGSIVRVEPAELFDSDDSTRRTGRLLPGESVGVISVEVTTDSGVLLRGAFDVRSAKFSDDQAFGRMLSDLADLSVEAIHQGFAPSSGRFGSAAGESARLL